MGTGRGGGEQEVGRGWVELQEEEEGSWPGQQHEWGRRFTGVSVGRVRMEKAGSEEKEGEELGIRRGWAKGRKGFWGEKAEEGVTQCLLEYSQLQLAQVTGTMHSRDTAQEHSSQAASQ